MNILSIYADSPIVLLNALGDIGSKVHIQVIHAEEGRMYNDATHNDECIPSVTFKTPASYEMVQVLIADNKGNVFLCEEELSDWE